jgi:hypothetical protein
LPNNNPTGENGARLGVLPQHFQTLSPQRQQTATGKSRKSSVSPTASRVTDYHRRRAAELRQIASVAPWQFADIANELRARADLMERGHHEGAAASIAQNRHLELT